MSEDYSQPQFYRFNLDSIQLSKWAIQHFPGSTSVLDLGAGSGVIGLEIARTLKPRSLTFVELQEEFLIHLQKNCQDFLPAETVGMILHSSFSSLNLNQAFDLIVCNPPYYLPGRGELPKDPQRAKARTFMVDSWDTLFEKVHQHLNSDGRACFVLKNDMKLFDEIMGKAKRHRLNLFQKEISGDTVLFALNKN